MVDLRRTLSNLTNIARDVSPLAAGLAGFRGASSNLSTFDKGLAAIQAVAATAQNQVQPRASETGQSVAVSITDTPPRETAVSGEAGIMNAAYRGPIPSGSTGRIIQAGGPLAIIPPAVSAGRGVMNMLGLAGGAITVAPFIIDPLTGEQKKLRVTRKLKSDVKKAVEMFGVEFVAEQMGTDVDVVFYILTKRMRNDGPYVTKAAVRKTRQTVRKMKNLCDMYDDLRPAARRRAPARKTMSTRITNVK